MEILSSVPNSPLTPNGLLQNFTPNFPNSNISNKIANHGYDLLNLTSANLRYHAMQQQSLNQNNISDLGPNDVQAYTNISPRSMNGNSSGYLSQMSQVEQLNGIAMNNFKQAGNQIVACTPTNITPRHFNERDIYPFEVDNRLLTPVYHSVSACIIIVRDKIK